MRLVCTGAALVTVFMAVGLDGAFGFAFGFVFAGLVTSHLFPFCGAGGLVLVASLEVIRREAGEGMMMVER